MRRLLLLLALMCGIAAPSLAQNMIPQTWVLLNNASASGPSVSPMGGSYLLNLSGTFSGSTVNVVETSPAGQTFTLGSYTATPSAPICFAVPENFTVQAQISGGPPSGMQAYFAGVGSGGCAGTSSSSTTIDSGNVATSGDTTITLGGTAQNLFSGTTPAHGFACYNPDSTNDLWVSDSTTAAANGQGSIICPHLGGYETPPGYKPVGVISIVGAVTGQKITARKW